MDKDSVFGFPKQSYFVVHGTGEYTQFSGLFEGMGTEYSLPPWIKVACELDFWVVGSANFSYIGNSNYQNTYAASTGTTHGSYILSSVV